MTLRNKERISYAEYLVDDDTPFVITEAFRNLMNNVSFAVPKKTGCGKVICVSSCVPGEGKSTVSANLALTYARSGYRTILVDCDMRKPRISSIFHLRAKNCIISYLSGQCNLEDAVIKGAFENLDILPCSRSAPNPTTLLHNEVFDILIKKLSEQYEYIIIDTPPANVVSDAVIIAKNTDGIVLVTRKYITNHKLIKKVLAQIEFSDCRFLGFVWNGATLMRSEKYKYGYSYSDKNS